MKRWMIVIATVIISMVLGTSVVYADEVNMASDKSVSVRFEWDDFNDKAGVRPESVSVVLKANGDKMYTKMVNADTWSDTFYNLPAYIDGEAVDYSVEQYMVPNAGLSTEYIYVSTIFDSKENCYIITNKYREGQVVNTDTTIVEDIYVEGTIGEDVIDEIDAYQGIDYYEEVENNNYALDTEIQGEKMDKTPKTSDMYYIHFISYFVLALLSVGIIGYLINRRCVVE